MKIARLFLPLLAPALLLVSCNNGGSIPTYDPYQDVESIDDAQTALEEKLEMGDSFGQNITLNFPNLTENGTITIPGGMNADNTPVVTVNIGNNYDKILTIKGEAGYNGTVIVSIPSTATNAYLIVDLRQATVRLNGSYYQVFASVSPNSLYIEEACMVNTLHLEAGHAVIYGAVTNFLPADGTTYTALIGAGKVHETIAQALAAGHCSGVLLPPGTYTDQLTIGRDFSIANYSGALPVINVTAPAEITTPDDAYQGKHPAVYVNGDCDVVLKGIIVTTSGTSVLNTQVDGITVDGGASLTMDNVTVKDIVSGNAISGVQYGRGVTVYGNSALTVTDCAFSNINKNGIHVMSGSAAVSGSRFNGVVTPDIAQNGVVFMGGTSGSVAGCSFTDFNYTGTADATAAAILLYGTPAPIVTRSGNTFLNCDQEVATE